MIVSLLTSALVCAHPAALRSQPKAPAPVRLVVQVDTPTITVGQSVTATVQLKGASNQPSRAQKDYWIYIEVRERDNPFWKKSVQIKAGAIPSGCRLPSIAPASS
jgi:hypothetical protein